jgi:hypothetical protein
LKFVSAATTGRNDDVFAIQEPSVRAISDRMDASCVSRSGASIQLMVWYQSLLLFTCSCAVLSLKRQLS